MLKEGYYFKKFKQRPRFRVRVYLVLLMGSGYLCWDATKFILLHKRPLMVCKLRYSSPMGIGSS
jgi:hypothetical protein